jgi:wyosine [tRNA(Phe)-imidazoG37] synthetase (radical SAM superfamily)
MAAARLVFADESGQVFDHPGLEMTGASAGSWEQVERGALIPLPPGSELFVLPGRLPVGYNPKLQRFEVVRENPYGAGGKIQAVAAFMAPAYTQILAAAYQSERNAPVLPLFSYTAVGWHEGGFRVAGVRVDPLPRQDSDRFDPRAMHQRAKRALARNRENRLIQHLGTCALTYGCPAAKNYFLGRWEAPLPTSPRCNAACLGCISLQRQSPICATQERIAFVPSPEEIAGVGAAHLEKAEAPVVSFGQGCEGEPLLQGKTLAVAIEIMRRHSGRGTINLNTNGSLPKVVARLRRSGLDSIRVSMNSARSDFYHRYYRPRGYSFTALRESLVAMKADGGFTSINLLTLAGFTDEEEEVEALLRLIDETGLDLIQLRNLNIDPEWYLRGIEYRPGGKRLGILEMMSRIRRCHPRVQFGYFNPCLNPG